MSCRSARPNDFGEFFFGVSRLFTWPSTSLREARCLNPRPEMVTDERFAAAGFFDARDLVQVKYEMVRAVREDDVPVTQAAAAFGFSRQSYHATAAALEAGGLPALVPA